MPAFYLKIIALATMTLDHLLKSGIVYPPLLLAFFGMDLQSSDAPLQILALLGRLAFPIFSYMAAQGCRHTRNIQKYMARLLLFALISEIPFDLALTPKLPGGWRSHRCTI